MSNMLLWTHSIHTYWKPRETRFLMGRVLNDCRIKELLKLDYLFIYKFFQYSMYNYNNKFGISPTGGCFGPEIPKPWQK